jgi:type I restriction enzyme S subunit
MAVGGVVNNLNKEMVKKLNVMIPPQSHQQSFAQKIESIERQKELINQSIREAQTLFDSRMEYYFGE